ncbi:transmembrane emp24 domain-containing protein 5-like [Spodoptera litura]|uniref:Transmembrane emp24 domain-containing protein 5-like n=1 Tax=Spodoptera litura TaxID=69820 RepID=A0A9J7DVB4_SPOLT|nr:transmembrane emp24 domain-containing protein 5-like [Spodoptera litura]
MFYINLFLFATIFSYPKCYGQNIYVSDVNFRIEPGIEMCVYETGKAGQMLEVYYQVLDGQHGDLDINFKVIDPKNATLLTDYKSSENSIIMDLEMDGDYAFCMDNTYSMMNSKLVFLYVLVEDKNGVTQSDVGAKMAGSDSGDEQNDGEGDGAEPKEVLEWEGTDENGESYYLEVGKIADSLSVTLAHVVKSRHLLSIYAATKSRDSYLAFEDTFIVDVWSGIQISLMFVVGMLQVYMIKKLFSRDHLGYKDIY